MKKEYYPFLDGFRAIAVYWVLAHHVVYFLNVNKAIGEIYGFFLVIFSLNLSVLVQPAKIIFHCLSHFGNVGVDMFFVISGFLITGLLTENLQADIDIKRFYIRRLFKIMPQYLFAVIVAIIIYKTIHPFYVVGEYSPQFSHANGAALWSYFFFLQNYFIQIPMLNHTWSLVVEEHFYLFYPIILGAICYVEKDAIRRRKVIICVCLFLLIACNLIRYFYFSTGIPWLNIWLRAPHHFQTTLFRVDALAMGCLLKLFEPSLNALQKFWKYISPIAFLLAIVIYAQFYQYRISVGGFRVDVWYAYFLAYLAPTLLLISAFCGFVPLKLLVENPGLRWIGRNSYGIYIWHYILIFFVPFLVPYCGFALTIFFYFCLATAVGIITTTTLEKYFLSLRARIIP